MAAILLRDVHRESIVHVVLVILLNLIPNSYGICGIVVWVTHMRVGY
ncbi:hypothetical protein LINGRAHAP2_LOCUS5224 [Linum grandiflorum]